MKLNKLTQAILAGSIAFSGAAAAEEEQGFQISGNVALTTDYRFRGISQTDEGPAIQGGFDVEHSSGLYVGTWASSIDFGPGVDGTMEIDYYVGYAGEITDGVEFDLGYIYYDYPQADENTNQDYAEWYTSLSAAGFTLGYVYSDNFFGGIGAAHYYSVDYSFGLPQDISLDLHAGYQDFTADNAMGATTSSDSHYADYSVGLSKDWAGVNWAVAWIDTDTSSDECFGGSDLCDSTVVFTVSKSM